MEEPVKNVLREMRQTFNAADVAVPQRLAPAAGKVHRVKVFKSGNSLALRLPKALGLEAGMEMELTVDGAGRYMLTRSEPTRNKIDISGFAGKLPGFKPAPREDFEERPSTIAAREAARKAALGK